MNSLYPITPTNDGQGRCLNWVDSTGNFYYGFYENGNPIAYKDARGYNIIGVDSSCRYIVLQGGKITKIVPDDSETAIIPNAPYTTSKLQEKLQQMMIYNENLCNTNFQLAQTNSYLMNTIEYMKIDNFWTII